jgi:hypothetical protein
MSKTNNVASLQSLLNRKGGEFALENVTRKAKRLPNRVILHAKGGWGKTSFAAQVPGCIFLMVGEETGLWTLMSANQLPDEIPHFPAPATTKHDIELAISELLVKEHPFKALIIDSATMQDRIYQAKVCQEQFNGSWTKFMEWGGEQAAKAVAGEWDSTIALLDKLRDQKGMGVMLLTHSEVQNFKNPTGPDYYRWVAGISKHAWAKLYNWCDMCLFGESETSVDKANQLKNDAQTKGKAKGGEQRLLLTEWRATHDAKHRHGLPPEIECGSSAAEAWANFSAALKAGAQPK